jgi:ABC-type tungstate transport system substrate-binding protein
MNSDNNDTFQNNPAPVKKTTLAGYLAIIGSILMLAPVIIGICILLFNVRGEYVLVTIVFGSIAFPVGCIILFISMLIDTASTIKENFKKTK